MCFIHYMSVLWCYEWLDKVFKNLNFGHFLGHFFSIRLIRGSTYTRVYTVHCQIETLHIQEGAKDFLTKLLTNKALIIKSGKIRVVRRLAITKHCVTSFMDDPKDLQCSYVFPHSAFDSYDNRHQYFIRFEFVFSFLWKKFECKWHHVSCLS